MKYGYTIAMILLMVISLAAGFAKAARVPQEVEFFAQIGWNTNLVFIFGLVQISGALLTMVPKLRRLGLIIMATMFLLSAIQIFMTGNNLFGTVSLLPVILAVFVWRHEQSNIR